MKFIKSTITQFVVNGVRILYNCKNPFNEIVETEDSNEKFEIVSDSEV